MTEALADAIDDSLIVVHGITRKESSCQLQRIWKEEQININTPDNITKSHLRPKREVQTRAHLLHGCD